MSAKVYKDIISKEEINHILEWFWTPDNLVWESEIAISKTVAGIYLQPESEMRLNTATGYWPKSLLLDIVKRINLNPSSYDEISFLHIKNKNYFKLHTDSGEGNQETSYKNILIPLYFEEKASTVIFKNRYYGGRTGNNFTKEMLESCDFYDPNAEIDNSIIEEHLYHINKDLLKGLTIDMIYEWKLGEVLTFDRQQVHTPGSNSRDKTTLSLFTNK